jgi:mRNA interferase MazF
VVTSTASRSRAPQGHEQQNERYAVVVQANAYDHLSTWLVAPTTTKFFGSMIHPAVELLGQDVWVLVEQTTAVDPQRLGDFAGRLDPGIHGDQRRTARPP